MRDESRELPEVFEEEMKKVLTMYSNAKMILDYEIGMVDSVF